MPYLETVEELTEALADMLGLYQQRLKFVGMTHQETRAQVEQSGDWSGDHADDCECRMCWCGRMETRIRTAVANEARLTQAK